ncbi:MAG: hypothetical protein U9N49_04835 [Campylobacterota bacterium]|nr:hypothetical protein [Campylobacterota bacterium]
MSHKGMALMGVGQSSGGGAAINAAKMAIESPLLNDVSINGAMGILVHFHIHPDYPMLEMSDAMETIEENADEDANVIFGTTTDENIPIDEVQITIIATGFEKDSNLTTSQPAPSRTPMREMNNRQSTEKSAPSNPFNREKMVVNGYNSSEKSVNSDDHLDIPTFLRRQMD